MPAGGQPQKLLLEALEPRVLLNADTLVVQLVQLPDQAQGQDIVIRMAEEAVGTGTAAQLVQRVQVVDAADGNRLLAFGDMADIRAIGIAGSDGNDRLRIDAESFGALALPRIEFAGGGGLNSLVIDDSDAHRWQIDGAGGGSVARGGAVVADFTGVTSLDGTGRDTLAGPQADTLWRITGAGAGEVAGTAFAGFAHLAGAANNEDTFSLAVGGAMADGVDGGAGGFDSLVLEGGHNTVLMTAFDATSGTVRLDGALIAYTGLEPVTLPGNAVDITLTLSGANDVARLEAGPAAGQLQLRAVGTAETQIFTAPTGMLTIDLGGGVNSLTITAGLTSLFKSGLTVIDGGGQDTVVINSSLNTFGGAVAISADAIQLLANRVLNTTLAGGNAGNIALNAPSIELVAGSQLIADSATAVDGSISLTASATGLRAAMLPSDFTSRDVTIKLTGATLTGGDITISAVAEDLSGGDDAAPFATGFIGDLPGLLGTIPGYDPAEALAFAGIEVSVAMRGAAARITLDGATLASSGSVSIAGESTVRTEVDAIGMVGAASGVARFHAAAGYAQAKTIATTTLTGATTITAAGDVAVTSMGDSSAIASAVASADSVTALASKVDGKATSIAVAIARNDLTATTSVGTGVNITAAGSVNILATGREETSTNAETQARDSGLAGISVGLAFDDATVLASMDGSATAGGTLTARGSFNGGGPAVDIASNRVTLPGHGLQPGEAIRYIAGAGNAAIGGLEDGATYYVLPVDADTIQLSDAPVIALDAAGTDPLAQHSMTEVTNLEFSLGAIDSAEDTGLPPLK